MPSGLRTRDDLPDPALRPVEVLVGVAAVVVNVVIVPDVEGRVGEDQVDRAVADLGEPFEAIALIQAVKRQAAVGGHGRGLGPGGELIRG